MRRCSTKSVAALAGFEAEPEKKVVRGAKEEEGEEVEEYSWWARSGPKGWTWERWAETEAAEARATAATREKTFMFIVVLFGESIRYEKKS